jgi:hypothetical protein
MITAVTSSATVAWRLFRQKCSVAETSQPAGQSASGQDVRATPGSATRRGTCARMAAFRSALASVPARVSLVKHEYPAPTADHDRSGLLLQRPERVPGLHRAPSLRPVHLLLQVVEVATIFLRSKFRPGKDPCDQSRHATTGTVRRFAAWRDADGVSRAGYLRGRASRVRARGAERGCGGRSL